MSSVHLDSCQKRSSKRRFTSLIRAFIIFQLLTKETGEAVRDEKKSNGLLELSEASIPYQGVPRLQTISNISFLERSHNTSAISSNITEVRVERGSTGRVSSSQGKKGAKSGDKWHGIHQMNIIIDKDVYSPGDTVRGVLTMVIDKRIKARSIKLEARGKGISTFNVNMANETERVWGFTDYYKKTLTVWGNVVTTAVVDHVGSTAVFGPPWDPTEGVVYLQVDDSSKRVVLRVLHQDMSFYQAFGYVSIPCKDITSNEAKHKRSWPLSKGGTIWLVSQLVDPGEAPYTKTLFDGERSNPQSAKKVLKVTILKVEGLRKATLESRNNVYVQAFVSKDGSGSPNKPPMQIVPMGDITYPFEFKLPDALPTSNDRIKLPGLCGGAVRYSIRCAIDRDIRVQNPAVKRYFTVISGDMPAIPPIPVRGHRAVDKNFAINAELARSDYAPGEHFELKGTIQNLLDKRQAFVISIIMRSIVVGFRASASEEHILGTRWVQTPQSSRSVLWQGAVDPKATLKLEDIKIPLEVPTLPGSYWPGGLIKHPEGDWGKRFEPWRGSRMETYDSARWRYDLQISKKGYLHDLPPWKQLLKLPIVISNFPSHAGDRKLHLVHDSSYAFPDDEDFVEGFGVTSRLYNEGTTHFTVAEKGSEPQVNLRIVIAKADQLKNGNQTVVEAYVQVEVRDEAATRYRTATVEHDVDPHWHEECFILGYEKYPEKPLVFQVLEEDILQSDTEVGRAQLWPYQFKDNGFTGSLDLVKAGVSVNSKLWVKVKPFGVESKGTIQRAINNGIEPDEIVALQKAGVPLEQIFPHTADLKVTVKGATHVFGTDITHTSDPFCVVDLSGKSQHKTKTVKADNNPTWNEVFVFKDSVLGDSLYLHIYDADKIKAHGSKHPPRDEYIGSAVVGGRTFMPYGFDGSLIVEPAHRMPQPGSQMEVQVMVEVVPPKSWTPPKVLAGKKHKMAHNALYSEVLPVMEGAGGAGGASKSLKSVRSGGDGDQDIFHLSFKDSFKVSLSADSHNSVPQEMEEDENEED